MASESSVLGSFPNSDSMIVVVLKSIRECAVLIDACIKACRCRCVTLKLFFKVILVISSSFRAFLRFILSMERCICWIVIVRLLETGSGYVALVMSVVRASRDGKKNAAANWDAFPSLEVAPLIVRM